jgi:hypothetical protein
MIWQFTLTSTAVHAGVYGKQTAVYSFDPATLTIDTTSCFSTTYHCREAVGSVSVQYSGLVNGSGSGALVAHADDFGDNSFRIGGTVGFGFSPERFLSPHPVAHAETYRVFMGVISYGGEDGWRWTSVGDPTGATSFRTVDDLFTTWSVLPVPEPATIALLAIALVLALVLRRRT